NPEVYWTHPRQFIDTPMLERTKKSSQVPTGGAVYFDRGVIEVVTPLIEIAPGCSARAVRSLWEQIEFVRDQLTQWERRTSHAVRLKAYSTHYNISFELPKREQNANRNIKKLALLLAYILPIPVMLLGANRRSTGIGVRPRSNRIEVTADFTPDPGLMIATSTLIVGIVREVLSWPSYELSVLDEIPVPLVKGVIPGKHTTRKGWLTKDFHYPQSPFTCDVDAPIWETTKGTTASLRCLARDTAGFFAKAIRRYADPFSYRLAFAILEGRAPSLLEMKDRPVAYEDVGRLCRWGMVIHEFQNFRAEAALVAAKREIWGAQSIEQYIVEREKERYKQRPAMGEPLPSKDEAPKSVMRPTVASPAPPKRMRRPAVSLLQGPRLARRRSDRTGRSLPARPSDYLDRRSLLGDGGDGMSRRRRQRRKRNASIPFPDRRLTRSAYERVFLKLVSGGRLRIGKQVYTPVGMKGWYHAIFRRVSDGQERLLTIDQLLKRMGDWV
ncbi:MAG TPA: hypothetical protein VIL97_12155, partial [Thermoanaerobaculia bacterium]